MTISMSSTYLFSLMIIFSLIVHVSRKENKYKGSYTYYRSVIISTAILTTLEMLSWIFDGHNGPLAYVLNYLLNYLLMYLSALPITLWFMYFDYWIHSSTEVIQRKRTYYLFINIMIFILVTINIFKPILFYINESNEFVGTKGAVIIGFIQLMFLTSYLVNALMNKKKIKERVFNTIILLYFLPIIGVIIQATHMGSVFIWPLMIYVAFYAFLLIEREEMSKDPLTNLFLRRHLESAIINELKRDRSFTLIMIDLDDFKHINDNYGHLQGDQVLRSFADILSTSTKPVDSVFRYAGDEFVILLRNINSNASDTLLASIHSKIDHYNSSSKLKGLLSMSYGILRVDKNSFVSFQDLLNMVDKEMYLNKNNKKKNTQHNLNIK